MRYTNHGSEPKLERLGQRASFASVYETAYWLGYRMKTETADYVLLCKKDEYSETPVAVSQLVNWFNDEMELRGIIKPNY